MVMVLPLANPMPALERVAQDRASWPSAAATSIALLVPALQMKADLRRLEGCSIQA